ncbi:MAG: hypothetical protein LHV69_05585 [Elusimicrobia bacterium]|nr:hypothetical protein [Candidatus Obscuribacterium magneticum]
MQAKFYPHGDGFIIESYNLAQPFSSFLPALAGMTGKPMWVFYANRGQCISGFGVNDKDGAMLEFLPANKAYQATPLLGFRTFIKAGLSKNNRYYEPFIKHRDESHQVMIIRPQELEIHERQGKLGLEINVTYFGVPYENVPVLLRRFSIKNLTSKTMAVKVVDGLPRVVPLGMDNYLVKNMSRTIEAFAAVENQKNRVPFFQVKIQPDDRADFNFFKAGFFSFSVDESGFLPMIVDPQGVFGPDTAFMEPLCFERPRSALWANQQTVSLMPSAFSFAEFNLPPQSVRSWLSLYGHAENVDVANRFAEKVASGKNYFEQKREEMRKVVGDVMRHCGLRTNKEALNRYAAMTFMDNVLRGGLPIPVIPKGPIIHVFSRKHGDMERDYNHFQISATYYSQGNGNFRDVNQNRRSDLFINPQIGAGNIESFFNLLQLDGYNPLIIDPVKFVIPVGFLSHPELRVTDDCRKEFDQLKREPQMAGRLCEFVFKYTVDPLNVDKVFQDLMADSVPQNATRYGEGYWIDHWTYNIDHLMVYLSIFPDKKGWLFFEKDDFTYFDPDHYVKPRKEKYVVTPGGQLRQYHAVQQNQQKRALINSRKTDPQCVRTDDGKGAVLKTNLFVKLFSLVVVKISSLDPFGVGIEMEADRPGWCDALNGLPGLFGSSTNEMFELLRLIRFLRTEVLPCSPNKTWELPQEVYAFYRDVDHALQGKMGQDFRPVWNELTTARELFREKTFFGVSGKTRTIRMADAGFFFDIAIKVLERAEKLALDPVSKLPSSYFMYDIQVHELDDGWRQMMDKLPWKQHRVAPFLEASVHYLKLLTPKKARRLYQWVRKSDLWDRKLEMYRLNSSLDKDPVELGRIKVFSPGWLENQSIFLHMHYKFLLEILRAGLVDVFFKEIETGWICFRDPKIYGRSIYENSSFIASTCFPNPKLHGKGFVARLSGATSEFLTMIYTLVFGENPFKIIDNHVVFSPDPILPADWFMRWDPHHQVKNVLEMRLFNIPVTYLNPRRRPTFAKGGVKPVRYEWIMDGRFHHHAGRHLPPEPSQFLREKRIEKLTIVLG